MVDAYVMRCMHRRCNYNKEVVERAYVALLTEQSLREQGITTVVELFDLQSKLGYYLEQYQRTQMADVVILPYIKDGKETQYLPDEYITKLLAIVEGMLQYDPFPLVTVHDEFKAHPNHLNHVRQQYINILAELSESNVLSDILSQIHGTEGTFPKLSTNLSELIRQSNYALS